MCILCDPSRWEEAQAADHLDIAGCPSITALPEGLPNLWVLECSNCPLLTSIASYLPRLMYLYCNDCPLLTTMPNNLPNLTRLYCEGCPGLRSLPNTMLKLQTLWCPLCPHLRALPRDLPSLKGLQSDSWIDHPSNYSLPSSRRLAEIVTRHRLNKLRCLKFDKFISTPAYSSYLDAPPNGLGYRVIRRNIHAFDVMLNALRPRSMPCAQ